VRLAAKNESRLRALERWRAEKAGEERRVSTIGAGAGGVVGGDCEGDWWGGEDNEKAFKMILEKKFSSAQQIV